MALDFRFKDISLQPMFPVALCSLYPLIYSIPNISNNTAKVPLSIAAMALTFILGACSLSSLKLRFSKQSGIGLLLFTPLLVVWATTVFRGANAGTIDTDGCLLRLAHLLIPIFIYICVTGSPRPQESATSSLPVAAVLPVFVSLLFLLAGITNDSSARIGGDIRDSQAVLLGLLGIDTERVRFSLATGINSFGIYGGFCLVFGISAAAARKYYSATTLIVAGISVVLLVDSRVLILLPLASYILGRWLSSTNWLVIAGFIIAIPLWPAILFAISLASSMIDLDLSLGREGEDITTLNARSIIWASALSQILGGGFNHIFGYGLYGQDPSGVSDVIRLIGFSNVADIEKLSMHNTYLQHYIDGGMVSLAIYLGTNLLALTRLASVLRNESNPPAQALFAAFVFILLYGGTEVVGTLNADGYPVYILMFISAFLASKPISKAKAPIHQLSVQPPRHD